MFMAYIYKIGNNINNKVYIGKTISTIKSILNDDKSKLTLGLSLIGVGGALVLSIYIKVPQQ